MTMFSWGRCGRRPEGWLTIAGEVGSCGLRAEREFGACPGVRGLGARGTVAGKNQQRGEKAESKHGRGPLERDRVAVDRWCARETGRVGVGGGVAGSGTREDRAQQRRANRPADLL